MRKLSIRMLALLLCALFAFTAILPVSAAGTAYRDNPRFKRVTNEQSTQMFENGERFLLYCYRPTCGNCRAIGGSFVTEWMDTYNEDISGLNIDDDGGIPSWVWSALGLKSATLPVIVFVQNHEAAAFSGSNGLDALRAALPDAFAAYHATKTGLTIEQYPDKLVYKTGEAADFTGLTIRAVLPDGTVETADTGYTCSALDTSKPGTQTVTVSYKGLTAAFDVHVDSADGTQKVWILPNDISSLDYGAEAAIAADTDNLPAGGKLVWQYTAAGIAGRKTFTGEGSSFTVRASGFSQTVTVEVVLYGADGKPVAKDGTQVSASQTIRFRCGIAQRIAYLIPQIRAFFEGLFK